MMPIALNREKLLGALKVASGIKSDTLPILAGRKLEVRADGRVIVTANDLDVALEIIGGRVSEGEWAKSEALVLPGETLLRALAAMEEGGVLGMFPVSEPRASLREARPHAVRLECAGARVELPTLPVGEFPGLPGQEPRFPVATLPVAVLWQGLKHTLFTCSDDETRHVLQGVCLEVTTENLRLVATDCRRLTLVDYPAQGSDGYMPTIVPAKAAELLVKLLAWQCDIDHTAEVTLEAAGTCAVFAAPLFTLWVKPIEGTFPNYAQVIPDTSVKEGKYHRVAVAVAGLKSRLELATCVLSDREQAVRLSSTPEGLRWAAAEADRGEAEHTLPLKFAEPEWPPVGLKAGYVREALAHTPGGMVELCVKSPLDPVVLECGTWRHVLMPMRPT